MAEPAPAGFLSLPDEVIQSILSYLPPPQITSVQLVSRRFSEVALEPVLWRNCCISSFRWWHKGHHFNERLLDPANTDWRRLYADRHRASKTTQSALDRMLDSETGRLDQIQRVLDAGYDAKEVLLERFYEATGSERHLAQRYWSHAALGCLHRMIAVEEWLNLKFGEEAPDATERSFAALDMFILDERREGDVDDIFTRLNSYVSGIRAGHPDIDAQTPRQKATTIAEYLISHKLVGIQDDRNYHSLDHLFFGVSLFSTNNNSVPLISAVTYSYIARQFHLYAQPVSYPFHVHVLVHPPAGIDLDGNPCSIAPTQTNTPNSTITLSVDNTMYMDPFTSSTPIPTSHLLRQLHFIAPASSASQRTTYLSPSTPRDLTIRAAHNILSAPQHYSGPPLFPINASSATYASLFALVLLPSAQHPAQLRQHLAVLAQEFLQNFDLDVHIFESYILPLTTSLPDSHAYRSLLRDIRTTDSTRRTPKLRHGPDGEDNENTCVKFRVGQVFRHRMRGYLAVIYGWDPYCKMQEQWIAMNQVDRLGGGRGQPFYNVLVDDESTRYVAEENVNLLPQGEMSEEEIIAAFPIEIGKWFLQFDATKRNVVGNDLGTGERVRSAGEFRGVGEFVSNVVGEYPDG